MQGKPKRNLFSFTPTQFSDYKNNYKERLYYIIIGRESRPL